MRRALSKEKEPLAAVAILRPLGARPTSIALHYEVARWHASWMIDWTPPPSADSMESFMRRAEKRGYVAREMRKDGRAGWVPTAYGTEELYWHDQEHPLLVRANATSVLAP